MVLCTFAIEADREVELKEMGVRDSKLLSHETRVSLAKQLRKMGDFVLTSISAVDLTIAMRRRMTLNELEAKEISASLVELGGRTAIKKVFVDSPDPIAKKFELRIRKYCDHAFEIVCENKADFRYPVVGAASIIAKVERDAAVDKIRKVMRENGVTDELGSGYSHDAVTIAFLKQHSRLPALQEFIRHEWETAKRLKTEQVDLGKFI
jgi:ribonuclease HII